MDIDRNQDPFSREFDLFARTTMATVLIVAAVATLVITSLIRPQAPAAAQTPLAAETAPQSAPTAATIPMSVPPDTGDVGHFAFGYLVFDWDPQAPGGVPGFDSWPPGSRR